MGHVQSNETQVRRLRRPRARAPASQPHAAYGPTACSRLGPGSHLASAEVQVQVARVRVECEAFQKGPGRGCHRGWRELGKGAPGRERIPRRKGQDAKRSWGR